MATIILIHVSPILRFANFPKTLIHFLPLIEISKHHRQSKAKPNDSRPLLAAITEVWEPKDVHRWKKNTVQSASNVNN